MCVCLGVKIWLTLGVIAWTWHFHLRGVRKYGESYFKSCVRYARTQFNCYVVYGTPRIQAFTKSWWTHIFPIWAAEILSLVFESVAILIIPPIVFTAHDPHREEF